MTNQDRPGVGVVMLSMGDRPGPLAEAIRSVQAQQGVDLDIVLVGNGWEPEGLPDGVRTVYEPENTGIPQGRNIGAAEAIGEFLFFFDDDATIPESDVLARLVATIQQADDIALCQPGLTDPVTGEAPRRWVPRLRVKPGELQGGQVATFSEGVVMIRRSAFVQVGGWPGNFFFGHEGIDLAWRLMDAGWRLWYAPEIPVNHPYTEAARHPIYYRTNARNRVWVAKRNLPAPLVPLYLGTWTALTLARVHDKESLKVWFRGFGEGVRTDAGERIPMRWKTVRELTRAGRPPII